MRFPRLAAVSAATLLGGVLLVTGCGSGSDSGSGSGSGSAEGSDGKAPETRTGTLEELAAMTTCKPDVQIDADELRQGVCKIAEGRYVLTTFSTAKGKRAWLNEAKPYGGSYLVGSKWVAVGTPELLGDLRTTLGGEVENGDNHGSGNGEEHGADHKG